MTAELINFSIKTLINVRIIGKEIRCKAGHPDGNPIPAFWGECFKDGTIENLKAYPDQLYPDVLLGWIGDFNPADNTFSYIIGILTKAVTNTLKNMTVIDIPNTRFGVGAIKGTEPAVYMAAHNLTEAEIKKNNLQIDYSPGYEIEWYGEDFCKNEDYKIIDLYVPITY